MEYTDVVMSRYATKKFNGKTIPEEKVQQLLEIIRNSPSSFNLQPWKIKIITDQETKDNLLAHSWGQPQVSTCSHLIVFLADTDVMPLIDKLEKQMKDSGVPAEKVEAYSDIMRNTMKGMNKEQLLHWAEKQIYIALANALNGAKALGFDSCPMEGFVKEEYNKALDLPEHLHATVLCPIGYPDDEPRPKLRFPMEDIVL